MQTETITGQGYSVTISAANVAIGVKRQQLIAEAALASEADRDRLFLRRFTYPDVVACVVDSRGFSAWPVSFEAYLDLPEQFAYDWERAVYRLNPHWLPLATRGSEEQRQTADELHRRLTERVTRRNDAKRLAPELPDALLLHDLETSWRVWQLMEATGWKFPPAVVMAEPAWLLEDLLTISSQNDIVERMLENK